MDEYVGLSFKDPKSYCSLIRTNFFNHIDIPEENINLLNSSVHSIETECHRYEKKLNYTEKFIYSWEG